MKRKILNKKTIILIIIIYIVKSTIFYFLFDGFYFTSKYRIKDLSANNNSTDQLDVSVDKVRNGVYAGLVDYKNKRNYLFQFSNMFEDENRLLNIYFPINNNEEAYFIETDEQITGINALLILRRQIATKRRKENKPEFKTAEIFNSYYQDVKLPNPQLFTKKLGANLKNTDSLFVLSFDIYDYQDNVQMLQFVKNAYGYYNLRRYKAPFNKNKWELKDNSKQKEELHKGIIHNTLLAIADIITAIFQLIAAIFYYIYIVILLIVAVFTGGFVK